MEGHTIEDVRAAHEQGRRATLKTARPDLPPALVRVIRSPSIPIRVRGTKTAGALAADLKALTASPWARRFKYLVAAAAVLVVAAGAALGTSGWRPFGSPKGPPRLAVLPFENLSAHPDSDAFALGLSWAIQNDLANVQGISLHFVPGVVGVPRRRRDLRQAAAGLGADLLLVG